MFVLNTEKGNEGEHERPREAEGRWGPVTGARIDPLLPPSLFTALSSTARRHAAVAALNAKASGLNGREGPAAKGHSCCFEVSYALLDSSAWSD